MEYALNLYDKVYLEASVMKTLKTKVLFAIYHNMELSKTMNDNKEEFKNYFTFANSSIISCRESIVDELQENIAKLMHMGYGEVYKKDNLYKINNPEVMEKIKKAWIDSTRFSDRESNRSQALHLRSKLLSLGLEKEKVEDDYDEESLLENNTELLDKKIGLDIDYPYLEKVSELLKLPYVDIHNKEIEDFYNKYLNNSTLFSKLIRCEHSRWNTFHYLNGWQFNPKKNKTIKHHNCLTSFEKFETIDKLSIIYDIYSIVYIPNYLASGGYKLKNIETDVKIAKVESNAK